MQRNIFLSEHVNTCCDVRVAVALFTCTVSSQCYLHTERQPRSCCFLQKPLRPFPSLLCRTTKKGYEEVHVPALKPKPFADNEKLLTIQELPEWAQPAFGGMQSLNRVQSRVSDCALYSSENMLVCAPTGGCWCHFNYHCLGQQCWGAYNDWQRQSVGQCPELTSMWQLSASRIDKSKTLWKLAAARA